MYQSIGWSEKRDVYHKNIEFLSLEACRELQGKAIYYKPCLLVPVNNVQFQIDAGVKQFKRYRVRL